MVKIVPQISSPTKEEDRFSRVSKLTRDIYLEKLEKTQRKSKQRCCSKLVFHPDNIFRMLWDVIMLLLIIYESLTIPYLICFNQDYPPTMQNFELLITCCFFIDITVSMNTGFYVKGSLVLKRREIIKSYMKFWFWIDLISTFPYDWVLDSLFQSKSNSSKTGLYNAPKVIRIIRIIRFLRILRLLRLAKLKKILIKIEDYISNNFIVMFFLLFRLLSGTFLAAHWLACLWFFIGDQGSVIHPITWVLNSGIQDSPAWEQYITSLYWALTTLSTVGYGDIVPVTVEEKIFAMFTMIVSSGVFAYTLGSIGSIVSKNYALENSYRETFVSVNSYMKKKKLEHNLQFRVRRYLEYLWEKKKTNKIDQNEVLDLLSEPLRDEINGYINANILRSCETFQKFDDNCISQLTRCLENETFASGDIIFEEGEISDKIYFITNGIIDIYHAGSLMVYKQLKNKSFFGEIAFFIGGKRTAGALCREFSDLLSLSRSDLIYFLEKFPDIYFYINEIVDKCKDFEYSSLNIHCYLCEELGHLASKCRLFLLNLDQDEARNRWLDEKHSRRSTKVNTRDFPEFPRNLRKKVRFSTSFKPAEPLAYYKYFEKDQELIKAIKKHEVFLSNRDIVPSTSPTDIVQTPLPVARPRFSIFGSEVSEDEVSEKTPLPKFGSKLQSFSFSQRAVEDEICEVDDTPSPDIYKRGK